MPDGPADLLAARVRRDPAAPLLTYYDDRTGERTELSVATFANWVAKSANLLREEFSLGEGTAVAVLLPLHWQTAVLLLALWSLGAEVTMVAAAAPPSGSELVVVAEPRLDSLTGVEAGAVLALSLAPLNRPLSSPRPGVVDYAADVLACADVFSPDAPVDPDSPAVVAEGRSWTGRELVAAARGAGLTDADRVLSVLPMCTAAGVLAGLLAPLAAGGGVVLCAQPDQASLPHRALTERVTAVAGTDLVGLRRLVLPG